MSSWQRYRLIISQLKIEVMGYIPTELKGLTRQGKVDIQFLIQCWLKLVILSRAHHQVIVRVQNRVPVRQVIHRLAVALVVLRLIEVLLVILVHLAAIRLVANRLAVAAAQAVRVVALLIEVLLARATQLPVVLLVSRVVLLVLDFYNLKTVYNKMKNEK